MTEEKLKKLFAVIHDSILEESNNANFALSFSLKASEEFQRIELSRFILEESLMPNSQLSGFKVYTEKKYNNHGIDLAVLPIQCEKYYNFRFDNFVHQDESVFFEIKCAHPFCDGYQYDNWLNNDWSHLEPFKNKFLCHIFFYVYDTNNEKIYTSRWKESKSEYRQYERRAEHKELFLRFITDIKAKWVSNGFSEVDYNRPEVIEIRWPYKESKVKGYCKVSFLTKN